MELRKAKKEDMLSKRRNVQVCVTHNNLCLKEIHQLAYFFQMDSDTDGEPTSPLQDASNRAAVAIMSMDEIKVGAVSSYSQY